MDIAGRRRKAKFDAEAVRATSSEPKALLSTARAELAKLKKANISSKRQIVLNGQIREHERAIREIEAKANSVESAAFDLKAVNPNAKANEDTRTPAELLEFIKDRNQKVADLIDSLKTV